MSEQSIDNLMGFLDIAKLKLNPLPTSYIADKADEYLKNIYATMLASVLVANGMISDNENRLFRLFLDSIGLEGETNSFISNISHLTQKQVLDFAKGLDTDDKRLNFIFEMLMLARINSPLNDKQLNLINELCNVWSLKNEDLINLDYWVKKILGIQIDESNLSGYLEVSKLRYLNFKNYTINEILSSQNAFNEKDSLILQLILKPVYAGESKKRDELISYCRAKEIEFIKAHETGILSNFHQDEKGDITISILKLPTYLKNWKEYLKQTNYV